MGRNQKWTWPRVRQAYITGKLSYAALSEKFGISNSTLTKVARREKWAEDRKKWRQKVAEESLSRACAREVDHLEALRESADSLAGAVKQILETEDQLYTWAGVLRESDGSEYFREMRLSTMDTKKAKDLSDTLKNLTATIRNLYGLPTAAEAAAQEIAQRRLALEEKRGELEARKAELEQPDKTIEIIMDQGAGEASG